MANNPTRDLTDAKILASLTDVQAAALTALREAGGDAKDGSSVEERIAVLCCIRNRVRRPGRFGDSYRAVCLRPWQFSCWNADDPNRPVLLQLAYLLVTLQPVQDPFYLETEFLAQGIVAGIIQDRTKGANHYHTVDILPFWAKHPRTGERIPELCRVGNHYFYNLK